MDFTNASKNISVANIVNYNRYHKITSFTFDQLCTCKQVVMSSVFTVQYSPTFHE